MKEWRIRSGLAQDDLGIKIGDPGGQYQRWESGIRPTLPLRMKVKLSLISAIPLAQVVDPDELETAREIVVAMARDAVR